MTTMRDCPLELAARNGVTPFASAMLGLAWWANKAFTALTWPMAAASISAVRPCESRALTSTCWSNAACIALASPELAAAHSPCAGLAAAAAAGGAAGVVESGAAVVAGAAVNAGGVTTAGFTAAAVAAAATGVSFLGTLVAWLALGVSTGDVLGVPLAPREVAVPGEFCTRALTAGVRVLVCPRALAALADDAWVFAACAEVAACAGVER